MRSFRQWLHDTSSIVIKDKRISNNSSFVRHASLAKLRIQRETLQKNGLCYNLYSGKHPENIQGFRLVRCASVQHPKIQKKILLKEWPHATLSRVVRMKTSHCNALRQPPRLQDIAHCCLPADHRTLLCLPSLECKTH